MSKGAILGTLAAAAVVGLGAAGYYWSLTAGGLIPSAASTPGVSSCAMEDVQQAVIGLVHSQGSRTNLLMEASLAKTAQLEKADSDREGTLNVETMDNCRSAQATSGTTSGPERNCSLEGSQAAMRFDGDALRKRAALRLDAMSKAKFRLDAIRLTSVNTAVGSKLCTAVLSATLPGDWGSASVDISYKIEQTADGKGYVSLQNLDQP